MQVGRGSSRPPRPRHAGRSGQRSTTPTPTCRSVEVVASYPIPQRGRRDYVFGGGAGGSAGASATGSGSAFTLPPGVSQAVMGARSLWASSAVFGAFLLTVGAGCRGLLDGHRDGAGELALFLGAHAGGAHPVGAGRVAAQGVDGAGRAAAIGGCEHRSRSATVKSGRASVLPARCVARFSKDIDERRRCEGCGACSVGHGGCRAERGRACDGREASCGVDDTVCVQRQGRCVAGAMMWDVGAGRCQLIEGRCQLIEGRCRASGGRCRASSGCCRPGETSCLVGVARGRGRRGGWGRRRGRGGSGGGRWLGRGASCAGLLTSSASGGSGRCAGRRGCRGRPARWRARPRRPAWATARGQLLKASSHPWNLPRRPIERSGPPRAPLRRRREEPARERPGVLYVI